MIHIRLDRGYYHLHNAIGDWCRDQFGNVDPFAEDRVNRWHRDMMFGYQDYYFKHKKDATFFTLKWISK
jgi:hypothetical protein